MNNFYFPFIYLFKSRLKTKMNKISWFIIYIIPIYFIGISLSTIELANYTFLFILSVTIFNSIYELGYLENDIQTTKNENNPTYRIDKKSYTFLDTNYRLIITFKILSVLLTLTFIYTLFNDEVYILQFIFALLIIRFFFYLHNKIRNQFNIITFLLLSSTKYILPLILLVNINEILSVWYILFLFPVLRSIEHSTKIKYKLIRWANIIGNHDIFRIKYYFVLLLISSYFYFSNKLELSFLICILYFLFYRASTFILINKNLYNRTNTGQSDLSMKGK